ncbi:MAG: FdhF/YdeP family oxidoreductase [Planctomycetales bacterium]|nr:FdhF/YdeP family oxidoreductase [Planctomycetales bacterium]
MKKVTSGGGWPAIQYTLQKAKEVGGIRNLWKAMRSKNACKTCALGMGGQRGGMVNESGSFPEVCKKSLQAMVADMQDAIPPEFWDSHPLQKLREMTPRELENCGRLVQPLICNRDEGRYRTTTWDDAIERIASRLKETAADETFWYFSGRSSNEAGFLLQLFARLYGTNNVNNCSYYCHQASGVGLTSSVGSGTATIVLEDVERADLVFLIGGNPASNHPRLMTTLKNIRNDGGEVIVINPVIETGLVSFRVPSDPVSLLMGTKIATQYVQPHIGGDLALLAGIAKRIVEIRAHDESFLANHCDGHEAWLEHLDSLSWAEITAKSGVTKQDIDRMADTYAKARNVVFSWTMGITHHANGVSNVQAIANLALLRGMVGRRNAGLMPIRGHSNVQGIGSVGVTPKLKDAIFENLQREFDVELPTGPGMDTLACMEAAAEGRMKIGFCLGGNLYGSNPDSEFAERSLNAVDTVVYLSTTLNTGHAFGTGKETIVLPVLARDEEPQPTTQESMFNLVRLSDGGPRRHSGPLSEVEVVARLAQQVLPNSPIDWQSMHDTGEIRTAIGKAVPGWEKIKEIDKTKNEFQISGRTFHKPQFPTPSGKAQLHVHSLPELQGDENRFRLMTVRSEGQFNTVVYEEHDLYRGQDRRDIVLLNPSDVQRLGLTHDQLVTVRSETGSLSNILVREFAEIKSGNALMYFPEANRLVPRTSDPQSKTPAFKGVVISIEPS